MDPREKADRLDRHALVMAVWLPLGLVALVLFRLGTGQDASWVLGGFGALLLGFLGHVIVNAVLGTDFTPGEVALGLVLFLAALLACGFALLLVEGFAERLFLPLALGFGGLAAAVVLYMVTRYGARGAFEGFDVVRDNNLRTASRLPHRGGRR